MRQIPAAQNRHHQRIRLRKSLPVTIQRLQYQSVVRSVCRQVVLCLVTVGRQRRFFFFVLPRRCYRRSQLLAHPTRPFPFMFEVFAGRRQRRTGKYTGCQWQKVVTSHFRALSALHVGVSCPNPRMHCELLLKMLLEVCFSSWRCSAIRVCVEVFGYILIVIFGRFSHQYVF